MKKKVNIVDILKNTTLKFKGGGKINLSFLKNIIIPEKTKYIEDSDSIIEDTGEIKITEPGIIEAQEGKGFTKIDTTFLLDFIKYKILYDKIDKSRGIMQIYFDSNYPLLLNKFEDGSSWFPLYVEKIIIIQEYNEDNVIEYGVGGDFNSTDIRDLDYEIQNYTYDNVYSFIQNYHDNFPNSSLFYNSLVYIDHNTRNDQIGRQHLEEYYDDCYEYLINLNLLSDNELIYVLGDL